MRKNILCGLVTAAALLVGSSAAAQPKHIAIAMFGPHLSLQQVSDGFKESLKKEGVDAVFDEGNVNFDRSLVPQFLNRLAAAQPDLMLTVTTPMAQSAKQILANRSFPIVFAPVTDPVQSGLLKSWEHGAPLLAGVSNMPDFDATLNFMKTLLPKMQTLGILYNPGDDSDTAFVDRMQKAAPKHNVKLLLIGVDNANDIAQRVTFARGKADALFVPASSLLQPAAPAIASAALRISMPVFGSNTPSVNDGHVLAAFSADFYRIGERAGEVAARLLRGADPASIPVVMLRPEDHIMRINQRQMDALGLKLPDALKDCDCVVK